MARSYTQTFYMNPQGMLVCDQQEVDMPDISDPMEALIHEALSGRFPFKTGDQTPERLDFLLTDLDIHIEVKRMHTPRIAEQMSRAENVIAVQGKGAVEFMAALLRAARP